VKIYVGNLSYDVTEQDLRQQFEPFGALESVSVIMDKMSGRSKGFGFVEMASKSEAEAAISGLNGKQFKERTMTVNEARPKVDNRGGGGSYGDRRGGGRDSRGGGRPQQRY
jgi:cold-inducible RNA-binding protein